MLQHSPLMVSTMAHTSNDKLPWDDVGTRLSDGQNITQTLREAGLDWDVVKRPAWVDVTPHGQFDEELLIKGGSKGIPFQPVRVKGNYVMLRTDTMTPVSPFVGPRYKPIQNYDAFKVFQDFCEAGNMTMETAGSLSGGEHIWGLAKINGEYQLCDGEFISGYFLLIQSHVYGSSLKAMFTPVRYPGGHMLVQAVNRSSVGQKTYTMPHSRHFNETRIAEIQEVMGVAERELDHFIMEARAMADRNVDDAAVIRYFIEEFNTPLHTKVKNGIVQIPTGMKISDLADWEWSNRNMKRVPQYMESYAGADLPTCKGTAWGVMQATNNFYDHEIGVNPDTRLISAWMGPNAKKKLAAAARAQQM